MGMAVNLVMRHILYQLKDFPLSHIVPTCNLLSIGQVVSERSFEKIDDADADNADDGRRSLFLLQAPVNLWLSAVGLGWPGAKRLHNLYFNLFLFNHFEKSIVKCMKSAWEGLLLQSTSEAQVECQNFISVVRTTRSGLIKCHEILCIIFLETEQAIFMIYAI